MNARSYDREGRLTRFSLDRRVTVLVLLLTTLVVGSIATLGIPVELFPAGFEAPFLNVVIPWADAPPPEVQDKIVQPLEEELSTVRGLDRIVTVASTGRAFTYMRFKQGTDLDVAYREVRDRVERAKALFPDDVDRTFLRKHDASGIPVYVLGVAVDPTLTDAYNLIQNEMVLPLSRLDGVASVTPDGLEEKEILIELDRQKASASGLNIYELSQRLSGDNFTLASGNVRDGERKLLLRSIARFDTVEDLEELQLSPSTKLRDVARVTYAEPEKKYRARAMSKPAVALVIFKEGQANVRDVSRAIDRVVDSFEENPRLASVEWISLFSQGEVIDEALGTLANSGAIGGVVAALTLFFFMRRVRLTLVIALCIPLSMLIGLTLMYFVGESLNLLTLLGLMICVGLLVDNSVVVAENIHRLHREGMGRRDACVHGAGEVALAITMSTLTTIVVFLPVALVQGQAQFFLLRLALPVCVSVTASLAIALIFIPLCVYLTLQANGQRQAGAIRRAHEWLNGVLRSAYEASFGRLSRLYGQLLGFFLVRRFELILLLLLVGASMAIPAGSVKFVDGQEEERSGFYVGVEMPETYTLEETESWFLEAEKLVESMKDELGLEGWFLSHDKTEGQIQGWFARPRTSDVSPPEATKMVRDALPKRPGIELTISGSEEAQDDDDGESVFSVRLYGEDYKKVKKVADELEKTLARVDGVLGLKGRNAPAPNELGLVIDRDRAQRLDVNPQVVAGVVAYALRGSQLPRYRDNGKEIPVRLRFQESDRESLTELANFLVPTNTGSHLPLSALTDSRFLPTPEYIVRYDKRTGRNVTLEIEEDREEETRKRLQALVASVDLPEGISIGEQKSASSLNEDLAGMKYAGYLSIIFIYLLMGFLFESFILPLSIILTIPLSAIGVWWTHFITGKDLDFLGAVAIVLLIGVVVNNGIVLIDYVNRLRNRGHSRRQALLTATELRFRPILMTAITTIGGMLPLALAGANSIGLSYTSFALTLIGGMTTATALTLLVVPVFYTFFDDAREACGVAVRSMLRRRSGVAEANSDAPV